MSVEGSPGANVVEIKKPQDTGQSDTPRRRPISATLLALYWIAPVGLVLVLDFFGMAQVSHLIFAGFSTAISVGIFRGSKWAYWISSITLAVALGTAWLQLIIPG